MKSTFLFFALFFMSLSTFAADASSFTAIDEAINFEIEIPADFLDKEVCYTTTLNVEIPVIGSGVGVEVTGCGDTANEALEQLMAGIARILVLVTTGH